MVVHTDDRESGEKREEISLYLMAEDPDGNDDLKSISVSSNEGDYLWSFNRDTWHTRPSGNALWVGQNRILPAGERFPDGNYTVSLSDGGGRTVSTEIYLSPNRIKTQDIRFPEVSLSGGTLLLRGDYPQYMIWLYDGTGQLLHSRYLRNGSYSVGELMEGRPEQPVSCWIFVFIEEKYTGLKTGPYYFAR